MRETVLLMLFAVLLLAFWVKLDWLVWIMVAALVAVALTSVHREEVRPRPVPKGEEVILHPVIYEDIGGPSLYPDNMSITYRPAFAQHGPHERMQTSIGMVAHGLIKGVGKLMSGGESERAKSGLKEDKGDKKK